MRNKVEYKLGDEVIAKTQWDLGKGIIVEISKKLTVQFVKGKRYLEINQLSMFSEEALLNASLENKLQPKRRKLEKNPKTETIRSFQLKKGNRVIWNKQKSFGEGIVLNRTDKIVTIKFATQTVDIKTYSQNTFILLNKVPHQIGYKDTFNPNKIIPDKDAYEIPHWKRRGV